MSEITSSQTMNMNLIFSSTDDDDERQVQINTMFGRRGVGERLIIFKPKNQSLSKIWKFNPFKVKNFSFLFVLNKNNFTHKFDGTWIYLKQIMSLLGDFIRMYKWLFQNGRKQKDVLIYTILTVRFVSRSYPLHSITDDILRLNVIGFS